MQQRRGKPSRSDSATRSHDGDKIGSIAMIQLDDALGYPDLSKREKAARSITGPLEHLQVVISIQRALAVLLAIPLYPGVGEFNC
jgi:hypothetical protein